MWYTLISYRHETDIVSVYDIDIATVIDEDTKTTTMMKLLKMMMMTTTKMIITCMCR